MSFCKFLALILLFPALLLADETPVLQRTHQTFDSTIPTLKSVLGYDFGEQITRHGDMEHYLNALAASSSKIKLEQIGRTYEGRALYYVLISSPENMARLEDLRQANLQLSDPRATSSSQATAIIDSHPIFVCLSYSVHGNEHSGVEAALAMAYYLLAAQDAETQSILKNTVVIIDPMQNPDGRERFISHFYSSLGKTPSPDLNAAEHNQSWPSGRTNHYLFDMNRDWVVMSQAETRARIAAYRRYQPQIFIDLHEMGENSTYFFPPPAVPHNPNYPASSREWWNTLGKAVAAEFDRNQVDYYTQERFDFWYPGYGDSWPAYNGALSGTFEQGSVRGLVAKRRDGVTVHYQDAIWHHFLASLATCKMASAKRAEKLRDFYEFRASATQEGKTGTVKQYILPRSQDPLQTDNVVRLLLQHGIEVRQAQADFRAAVRGFMDDQSLQHNFQRGDYIIALDQPLKRLIQVVFERESKFDPAFLKEEEQRRQDKEPTELYDITAWSLPLAEGIEAYWSADIATVQTSLVTQVPKSAVSLKPATYAYLLNYDSNDDLTAIWELLGRNVRMHFTTRPFTLDSRRYAAGSVIIRLKDNPDLSQTLGEISLKTGVEFVATSTGWTEEGPDLGSDDVEFLETPRIAIIGNIPTDPNSYGAIRYLFDQRYSVNATAINTVDLSDVDLKDYNVLILPDSGGSGPDYKQLLGGDQVERLKGWVQQGGTLIGIGGGASFLISDATLTSTVKQIQKFVKNSAQPAAEKDEKKETAEETESPDNIPGSIALARLNKKNFLTYGYRAEEIPVFLTSSNVFVSSPDSKAAVSYVEADRLKVGGILWELAAKRLEKKAYATEERVGSGHVILFAEDPSFRAAWEGLHKLLFNAVLFGPSL